VTFATASSELAERWATAAHSASIKPSADVSEFDAREAKRMLELLKEILQRNGELSGLRSIGMIGSRVTAMFAADLPAVLEELAQLALANISQRASDKLQSAIAQAVANIQANGIPSVAHKAWKSVLNVVANHRKNTGGSR